LLVSKEIDIRDVSSITSLKRFFFFVNIFTFQYIKAKKIKKVVNPVLAANFEAKWAEFKQQYGEDSLKARPILCFHGTRKKNLPSIVKNGLVLPGSKITTTKFFFFEEEKVIPKANGLCH